MLLEVKNVHSGYYPEVDIINDISISADAGRVTAVIGPNGCGKSTLMKTIYGFLKPRKGEILYEGESILDKKPHELTNMGFLLIPQTGGIFPKLSVYDNLRIAMWSDRKDKEHMAKSIEKAMNAFPILEEKQDKKAETLSGGMQKMLEASRVFLYDSKLVLFDEATAGLAPIIAKDIIALVEGFRDQGIGVIIVDHNIRALVKYADYIYNLGPTGHLVSEGPTEKYRDNIDEIVKQWI
ncbi:MAG: ABC transporter ATP-binding protein [Candidatus Thorarchaeota archaeon]